MSELRKGLSLTKTLSFLKKYNYSISCVYADKSVATVVFLECTTPSSMKTFFVHIPQVYRMDYSSHGSIPIKFVSKTSHSPSAKRQSDYILQIRGPLMDGDLLLVSSESLCYSKANNTFEFYDSVIEREEEERVEESDDEIDDLQKEANTILAQHKLDPISSDGDEEDQTIITPEAMRDLRNNASEEEDEDLEIVFEGYSEGEEIESLEEDDVSEDDSEDFAGDGVPGHILDAELAVGFIFYSIDVNLLFKKIKTFELEATGVYDQIEDGEKISRKQRIEDVASLSKRVVEKVNEKVKTASDQEADVKTQILRLTKILASTSELRERILKDPSRYKDTEEDVVNLITTTRGAIQELNIELARHREEVDELLINCTSSFKALMSI